MSVGLLILALVLFILLVVVHEMGHFFVARRNGVEVEEFGIFFPPRLWSHKTKKGWELSINALPLGGFVRLKGEHDADTGKGTYGAARLSVKVKILLAGVGMNLLAAFVLLTILAWLGMPQLVNNQFTVKSDTKVTKNEVLVGSVQNASPAAKVGLKAGDELTGIGLTTNSLHRIATADSLPKVTQTFAGQKVEVVYVRDKQSHTVSVKLLNAQTVAASKKTNNPKGYLGISPSQYTLQRSTWSAPIVGAGLLWQFTVLTLHGLGSAIAGLLSGNTTKASAQVTGPVGIFEILKNGTLLGYQFILMIIAVISLSLAVMNVLPIPALDGGKLFVTLIARALRKKLTEKVEALVYGVGFAFLMVLIVLITIVDVRRNF